MRLLFITRAFPPNVGGMERFAGELHRHYATRYAMDLLANSRGRKGLLQFVAKVLFFVAFKAGSYDVIHLYDGVLSPLILPIRLFSRAQVTCTVNGLDIVYNRLGYQRWIPGLLKQFDRVFCISEHTAQQCRLRGVPAEKLRVIPIGIDPAEAIRCPEPALSSLLSKYNPRLDGQKVLLTVGRLVKRKGHSWFISEVLNRLPAEYTYIIAGSGPEYHSISARVKELCLEDRVLLLGTVTDEEKSCLYRLADLFIMPNVHVDGDQEGFGIVVLEAGVHGVPVIATGIEGISDTVVDGKTGRLVPERDPEAFADAILNPGIDRQAVATTMMDRFGWSGIVDAYQSEFQDLTLRRKPRGTRD